MHVISKRTLRDFWERPQRGDAQEQLEAWHAETERSAWKNFADVKRSYGSASSVANNRVVFNIAGNKYRLIVGMNYQAQIAYVKFIGTHQEYDQIDASTI